MAELISINIIGQSNNGTNYGPIMISPDLTLGMLQLVIRKHLLKIGQIKKINLIKETDLIKVITVIKYYDPETNKSEERSEILTNSLQPIRDYGIRNNSRIYFVIYMTPSELTPPHIFSRLIELIENYEEYREVDVINEFKTILSEIIGEGDRLGEIMERREHEERGDRGKIIKIVEKRVKSLYAFIVEKGRHKLLEILLQHNPFQTNRSSIDTPIFYPDNPEYTKHTPFFLALHNSDFNCVELLLRAGCDISKEPAKTISLAVLKCITQYDDDSLKLLIFYHNSMKILDSGVYEYALNELDDSDGNAPIHKVVLPGYQDTLTLAQVEELEQQGQEYRGSHDYKMIYSLLSSGKIELDKLNRQGYSALVLAIASGNQTRVKILLEAGASASASLRNSKISLHIAESLIHCGANIDEIDSDGYSALVLAMRSHDRTRIETLLLAGASPSASLRNSQLSPDIIQMLIQYGANINEIDSDGETALSLALHDPARVELLVNAGANVNIDQGYNITPLMIACRRDTASIDSMRFLLNRGAYIYYLNDQGHLIFFIDDDGETALFQTFNVDKIHLLLQYIPPQYHSNYLNYRNTDDKTAYQVAQDAGEHKVCEYLASIGATYGGKKGKKNTRKGKGRKKRRKTKGKR